MKIFALPVTFRHLRASIYTRPQRGSIRAISKELIIIIQPDKSDVVRVMEQYGKLVYRCAYVKLAGRDRTAADDVYLEVFLAYMTNPPTAEAGSAQERAWFVRCTLNRCTDIFRADIRRRESELDESLPCEDEYGNPALDALLALPEKYRLAMYLRYVNGFDCAECAKMLKISASALRMRLNRGRKLFEELWGSS